MVPFRRDREATGTLEPPEASPREQHEAWREATRKVLELIAKGGGLTEILETLVHSAEAQFPSMCCSVLLLDERGKLRSGPAPSLPEYYRRACDGIVPGPAAGSCGTAVHRRARVVVEDVATDPLWNVCRAVIAPTGLRSCWSEPILSSNGAPLGTFAVYRRTTGAPSLPEIDFLESAAALARLAIERERAAAELRESEEKLRQAQKLEAVGRLAGGVAHDFNNLLTAILGHAEILARALPETDPRAVHARGIISAAGRGARLTRQLLTVSRRHVLVPRTFELNGVVADMATLLRRLIGEHIELSTRLDPEAGSVRADIGQLEQIVINLALNARDAMPDGGRLVLSTAHAEIGADFACAQPGAKPGPYCVLAVADDGVGMDEATRARIFEPFFTTKRCDGGTGLGLATVHGIVDQGGGCITVDTAPFQGTTFRVFLPAVAPEAAAATATALGDPLPRGRETILLVEDQDAVRDVLSKALADCGYAVLQARDGIAGLALAARHPRPIDLVVSDVVMPGMGGREMVRSLRAEGTTIPVLFISGCTELVAGPSELASGVDFLQKPFAPSTLAQKVREVLDRVGTTALTR